MFTETLLKEHFILYKGEIPLKVKKKNNNNKARWNFFSVGEFKEMLSVLRTVECRQYRFIPELLDIFILWN